NRGRSNISSSTISKTTEQENEVLARQFHMNIFQKGEFALAHEILSPDFVLHNPALCKKVLCVDQHIVSMIN
ncbi:MAG: hypothetical protein ACJ71C_03170, partial [Nitrososphaeraceae archaeon]